MDIKGFFKCLKQKEIIVGRFKDIFTENQMAQDDSDIFTDIDVYKLEAKLDLLVSDTLDEDYEQMLLDDIDQISEHRLLTEKLLHNHAFEMRYNGYPILQEQKPKKNKKTFIRNTLLLLAMWIIIFSTLSSKIFAQDLKVWCLVTDYNTQCIYYNLSSCQSNAAASGGVCVPKLINEGE